MVICLEQGADLHMDHLIPLPLTVSCFSKIQIGFTFVVPAHPGSPRQTGVCVCYLQPVQFSGSMPVDGRVSGLQKPAQFSPTKSYFRDPSRSCGVTPEKRQIKKWKLISAAVLVTTTTTV